MHSVLVGVDGSPESLRVVRDAAEEAARRRWNLRIMHVVDVPAEPGAPERIVTRAAEQARRSAPRVSLDTAVVIGDPARVLVDGSRIADLLVVGEPAGRIRPGGSVPARVAATAGCPILVLRGHSHAGGPVVAGVDGSPRGQPTLRLAAAEADRRGVELVALHAWREPDATPLGDTAPLSHLTRPAEIEHRRLLADAVAGIAEEYPQVSLRRDARRGSARRLLLACSRVAELVVVGRRGRYRIDALEPTSVSRHLVERSACPVLVVPGIAG
ncbi:nucleotide-binding universal stress UspA family protein [Actinoplanes octamycinicus]|uniref:Nucleotide-binding universal stress UspA family protein n=1 Tax=Actinoplanes octamycinicus TaxID=135948 RepID=A0A7W7MAA2_9ACTN|nr:universal stress protein [Actinoplanes octamycinicus]MBB4742834.1 nucleotide-binding universal stress UspA family protein [Actinoplanes octamycinicus]